MMYGEVAKLSSTNQGLMEEVRDDTREEVPPNVIFGKLIREGVSERESWFFKGILQVDINDQGEDRWGS